ncbi:hypothetical protein [Mucilaginibacter pedocola]|uniref:Uncharacterized protein n=1 Tax=Mucilaginibacter pedocola TaxID=1792845 RepID=A0A1S9P8W3_9SPHI|nr:hypothetical protein [Mucilaginibacter pedocola]OOQ57382.1 hypothetical protein BC343_14875 [Mucilaginibacter pedocola]
MKTLQELGRVILFAVVFTLLWHAKIYFYNPRVAIVSAFIIQPKEGYTWNESRDNSEHFLWENTEAIGHQEGKTRMQTQ